MGTRADFYIGRGEKAEWLGSVAYDGDPDNFRNILTAKTEEKFRKRVLKELKSRDDATTPDMGWPWPWKDSGTSDYSINFDGGRVWYSTYRRDFNDGKVWSNSDAQLDEEGYLINEAQYEPCVFPDMSAKANVTLGARSGAMLLFSKKKES